MNNPNFKIISVHYTQSKGCCWARHKVQQLYTDEEYTLQLDSHHRFVKGWDTKLKDMYEKLICKGIKKPLITAYLPSYNPENDPTERTLKPCKIDFKEFTKDHQLLCISSIITDSENLIEPIKANFFSAHFVFTEGDFIKEIPYDPELYFTGEEMSITIRAFTKGYSLFHPHILIAWHEYTRKNRFKHQDDDKNWQLKDFKSKNHYLDIFTNTGIYGIGIDRTIQDYINYSGIKFLPEDKLNEIIKKNEIYKDSIKDKNKVVNDTNKLEQKLILEDLKIN